jgi:glycosyltransferase involved in cell wall biosynthesis
MKILVLTGLDPRKSCNSGGVRTYNLNLLKIVKYLGYDLDFYETKRNNNLLKFNKKVYEDYDVVLINVSVYDKGFVKLIYELMMLKDKKVIVQCHGGSFHTLRFVKLYKLLFKNIIKQKSNLFLTLNDSQKNSLIEFFNVKSEKVLQIPNFIEDSFDIREKRYDGKLKFFYIGRITEDKGIFDFLQAFVEIKNNNIEFNIVGSGPDEEKLIKLVKDYENVYFHGKKFGQEKDTLFRENHVFVFLTKLPEGFPISVLEAMNYGMSILSTEFSTRKHLIHEGYNGNIINARKENIKDKIIFYINNQDVIKDQGIKSKILFQDNFSLEKKGVECFKNILTGL